MHHRRTNRLAPIPDPTELPRPEWRRSPDIPSRVGAVPATGTRPGVHGKFVFLGDRKLHLRGVTYGTFRPGPEGDPYPSTLEIDRDFARMAGLGINAVRTYTVPPGRLFDAAARHGLHVMVGIPWEQHVAFLDDRGRAAEIEARVSAAAQTCRGHPAILCYAVGNEIPSPIVRWHGRRKVERFIETLCGAVKDRDPKALVTYVNYPTTEYLDLPFLDLVCFNVYLEDPGTYSDYLTRLHHVAGDRPLVVAELGLDSRRQGTGAQAETLSRQIRASFMGGAAGVFVFAWSDAWHRGGYDVEDWDFGLVDRAGRAKPALETVRQAYAGVPFANGNWPRVSVIVCSYNGASRLGECFEGLAALDYPDFEVIVVDDGSTDATAWLAARNGFHVVRTANQGLSQARNEGLAVATGEIVAYVDDDACPDPDWLRYLVSTFRERDHVGIGGPNLAPPDEGRVGACIACAPGGPTHVMLSDLEAEHIPGCNMAFRTAALREVGGFDPRFRVAGDDVDLCWRLQDRGWTLGFSPAAVVWHRPRGSIGAFWHQQENYGRAEALLEQKWPERYNRTGHLTWTGRLYTNGRHPGWRRGRIYYGIWGSAAFQSVYSSSPGLSWWLPAMPEWYLVILFLIGLGILGFAWSPLLSAFGLAAGALAVPLAQATLAAIGARLSPRLTRRERLLRRGLVALLHVLQPLARLRGRIQQGLTPWRRRRRVGFALPIRRTFTIWSERWIDPVEWVRSAERALRDQGAAVLHGDEAQRWDLEPMIGTSGAVRVRFAVEEHGRGRQLCRVRALPVGMPIVLVALVALLVLGAFAAFHGPPLVAGVLLTGGSVLFGAMLWDSSGAMGAVEQAVRALEASVTPSVEGEPPGELDGHHRGDDPLGGVGEDRQ